ncbi:MAG: hypothetical protein GX594_09475 [Pirellulaceae bacterium]|nr:hypothetical protein [Pirellulaceae bacterium]
MPTRQTSPGTTELPSPPEEIPVPRGLPEAAAPAASVPTYSDRPSPSGGGEKLITLHVDDLDVRKALEIISRQTGTSILVSPGVSGAVTLDLRDKTADEVLNAIARLCRLSIQRADDIVFVTAESEVPEGLDGKLPVRVYHLNYMRSTDVESMVKPLLSPRGTISCSPDSDVGIKSDADKAGGNAMAGGDIVIVQDYENVLKAIDRVIAQIDVQPTQVLIEAVIISVKLNKGMEMGVNFALLDDAQNTLGVVGSGMALNAAAGFNPASVIGNLKSESDNLLSSTLESKTTSGTAPTEIKNTLTNKMETSSSGLMRSGYATNDRGVKFGWTGNNTTGFLKALETMGDTKVLACPRLLVVNKQRAEIQLGDRLGYKTLTQTQTSTTEKVEFMDTGTLLRLRPFISSDGMIRMEIHPERSSGFLDINDVPQTNTAQVTTNVVVPDGATIVIGGLMDNEVQVEYQGLPFLSRLPWIGSLFRDTVTKRQKKELIVILTPHIWRPETPERLNHIGPPRALGLESRVSTLPKATGDDPPELFAIPPGARPSDITPPPKTGIGQAKPKRQTPSDFYALPRPAPAQGPEAEGEVIISDAPFPESVRP